MKKIISVILTIIMLASLVPTLSFAEDEVAAIPAATPDANGHIMLFDLGNPQTLATAGYQEYAATPSAFAYEGKSSSLKWEMDITDGAEAANLYLPYTDYDLSVYSSSEEATVNVRFYSENVGSKFNIVYYGATTSTYYRKGLTEIKGGWQVAQVSLKDVMAKLTNYPTEKTLRITFNDDGWDNLTNSGYSDGDTVYIDQIWVDTDPDAYYDGKVVIWNADTATTASNNCEETTKLSDNTIINKYREFKMTGATTLRIKGTSSSTTVYYTKDSYKWLNAWVYSEQPQDDGFWIIFNNTKSYRCPVNQVDWTGWKLLSFEIPSVDIKQISILGYNWRNDTAIPVNSGLNNITSELTIGVDNIWLSNEKTSPQATYEATFESSVPVSSPYETTADELMNINLNTSDNVYNPHIYTKNKRLSFNSITYKDLVAYSDGTAISSSKKATLHVYDSEADSSADIIPTSTSYVNAWIYNPAPKYTWDGKNYAEIVLALKYRDDDDGTNKKVFIPANWSGWKLISIPVIDFGSDLAGKNVYDVYIQCNGGWYPVSGGNIISNDNTDGNYRTSGTCNVFGGYDSTYKYTYYNYFNYIDIERVWISTGAPKAAGTVVEADNTALKCPETAGNDINLFAATNVGKIYANVIAKNDTSCTKIDASILSDGTLVLPSDLDFGTDYYVYAEIYAPNGEKTPVELSFSSENYHIEDKESDGRTATITMHGNLADEYANSILIAAVYTDTTGEELESATVGTAAQDGIVTVTIPENVTTDGKKVSFFFVDSIGNIKPLQFNIQK